MISATCAVTCSLQDARFFERGAAVPEITGQAGCAVAGWWQVECVRLNWMHIEQRRSWY